MENIAHVVVFIKSFLEKNIGVNNLDHFELVETKFVFGIKRMRFLIDMDKMEVFQFITNAYGQGFAATDTSSIIQTWLRNAIEEHEGMKLVF